MILLYIWLFFGFLHFVFFVKVLNRCNIAMTIIINVISGHIFFFYEIHKLIEKCL